jgi:very-short-patch-repair endonuclease
METELEDLLFLHIKASGLPEPEREVQFLPGRKFRADFCWKQHKVVAEVQGGTYQHMAHSTGAGLHRDYEKLDLANLAGYRMFFFDRSMIENGDAVEFLKAALTEDLCTND